MRFKNAFFNTKGRIRLFPISAMRYSFHWFRRDMRLEDNRPLFEALQSGNPVIGVFILDEDILSKLNNPQDRRVDFIHQRLSHLQHQLRETGSDLLIKVGKPIEVWKNLLATYPTQSIFAGRDYEPYARNRDAAISSFALEQGVNSYFIKDHVIFEENDVLKDDGKPYTVFTPYKNKWVAKFSEAATQLYPSEQHLDKFAKLSFEDVPTLASLGFEKTNLDIPSTEVSDELLKKYAQNRDFPWKRGTSRLSLHLRFGSISTRSLMRTAMATSETFRNELIWRDFYHMILFHFPHASNSAFKPAYDRIRWENNTEHFKAWCEGKTGYPIVDAGMRELKETGFMHNRVRMIVASFLTKHLLIDWKWGEAWFARHLNDFDLAANNGGWQWAASSGCDAAPYFRVFNPSEQAKKFDPDALYIRKWVPELNSFNYPKPIVEHSFARNRAIERYAEAVKTKDEKESN